MRPARSRSPSFPGSAWERGSLLGGRAGFLDAIERVLRLALAVPPLLRLADRGPPLRLRPGPAVVETLGDLLLQMLPRHVGGRELLPADFRDVTVARHFRLTEGQGQERDGIAVGSRLRAVDDRAAHGTQPFTGPDLFEGD